MNLGLVNVPYFFSKLMAQVFENCEAFAVPYLDDIAIYFENWEDHLKHVDEVLKGIGNANLTIKPSKCKFEQNHTKYLGHVVGEECDHLPIPKLRQLWIFPPRLQKYKSQHF
ncbi:hypothetical protein AVEN_164735-1 [Araneus ventricosus]|uniref:Reverse transcriptase domain-containing protein n=1 Tax=Araneus ventricosus TaxID=182803 RepID=A0A4Y2HJV1_ARAVE|nr:hypothetical protein AVEN_164735-1 [Araneus ventricosus]